MKNLPTIDIKSLTVSFIVLALLSISIEATSQCNGPITLTTQAQVNAFTCKSTFNGNLVINDNGTDPIESLDPIWQNGFRNVDITGSLIVANCSKLPNLLGLDGILKIGGNLIIENCPSLTDFGAPWVLSSISGILRITDCPSLQNVAACNTLNAVNGGIIIEGSQGSGDYRGFDNISTANFVQIVSTDLSGFVGIDGLNKCSYVNIVSNSNLVSFSGLRSLSTIDNSVNNGFLQIAQNQKLEEVNTFTNLNSVFAMNIVDNANLSSCCFLLDGMFGNPKPDPLIISGNANGCKSLDEVNAKPTLTNCPSTQTINTSAGQCTANIALTDPNASDNCDLSTFNARMTDSNGNQIASRNASNGSNFTYSNLTLGNNIVEYRASDERGNMTTCSTVIIVEDNEDPVLSGIPGNVTILCNESFPNIPNPTVSDNCDSNPSLTASSSLSVGDCVLGDFAELHEYTFTATDASGNTESASWSVTVINDFSFDLGPNISICDQANYTINSGVSGGNYLWSNGATSPNISVNSSGTYAVTITSNNGCCFIDEVDINFGAPPNASSTGGLLGCTAGSVQIFGSSTTAGVSYSWTGPNSFTSSMQNPSVSSPGDYILTVTDPNGCTSTSTAVVEPDSDGPELSASGGIVDCTNTSTQITSSSTDSGVTFSWTGPAGFTSSIPNPTVDIAGTYTVTGTALNGCTTIATAIVVDNSVVPSFSIISQEINCLNNSASVTLSSSADLSSFSWSGPSGFTSTDSEPQLPESGTYTLIVTSSDGCTNSASVTVSEDFNTPNISASGGTITCLANSITLSSSSSTQGVSYNWSGPDEFTSTLQNPTASQPGTYTVTATGPNGCTATSEAIVIADSDLPDISAVGGVINCNIESVIITGSSSSAGATTSWSGPNGFTSNENSVTVSIPGLYTYTVIGTSGCESTKTVEVISDTADPVVEVTQGILNCIAQTRKFNVETNAINPVYGWSGPGNFSSSDANPSYSSAGVYIVNVTGENGCIGVGLITVDFDISYTYDLTIDGQNASIEINGGTGPFTITWDDGTVGNNVTGLSEGSHSLSIIDGLGCKQDIGFDIVISSTKEESALANMSIFPNPTKDKITVEWNNKLIKSKRIQIIDLSGRVIENVNIDAANNVGLVEFNLRNHGKGLYLIRFESESKTLYRKFIKI